MKFNLDPTYLRYIYDNLIKGSIHPENESELPDGLIGLYEEAFEAHLPVMERQQTLKLFALFALLKKEVSVSFVAEVLEESEEEILEFISSFATWFNAPDSGKYQLYHERLKVYLLQKLSEKEIQTIHEKLITRLEKAIEEQQADEFERYALEFLSEHLLVEAFENEINGKRLLDFTKNEAIWDRQIRISNKFDWSRKGLHQAASWTSKHDHEENIDCYLDLVQLHNKEQNDAESIVRLVANNEIDLALERITAFGGPSKEEKERQFILFMLCLMELTLLESKTKPWRKEAIEKLLKHLEEEIPVDHSLVNWCDFFSAVLILKITAQIKSLGLNIISINLRTKFWNHFGTRWIDDFLPFTNYEIEVIFDAINSNSFESDSYYYGHIDFAIYLSSIGNSEKALEIAQNIKDDFHLNKKIKICLAISRDYFLRGDLIQAEIILNQCYDDVTRNINEKKNSSSIYNSLVEICIEFSHQGFIERSFTILSEFINNQEKCKVLLGISSIFFKQKEKTKAEKLLNDALIIAREIDNNPSLKAELLVAISSEINTQGKFSLAKNILIESLSVAICIKMELYKSHTLFYISTEFANQRHIDLAIDTTNKITEEFIKIKSYTTITFILIKQNNVLAEQNIFQIGLENILKKINVNIDRTTFILQSMLQVMYKNIFINQTNEAINVALKHSAFLSSLCDKGNLINDIILCLSRNEDYNRIYNVIITNLLNRDLKNYENQIYGSLAECLNQVLNIQEPSEYKKTIQLFTNIAQLNSRYIKAYLLRDLGDILLNRNLIDYTLEVANKIDDGAGGFKTYLLKKIAIELSIKGDIIKAKKISKEIENGKLNKNNEFIETYIGISIELCKQGKLREAIDLLNELKSNYKRWFALNTISDILFNQGDLEMSNNLFAEANEEVLKLSNISEKGYALCCLSESSFNKAQFKTSKEKLIEATNLVSEIIEKKNKVDLLREISKLNLKLHNKIESHKIMNECLEIAITIENIYEKNFVLSYIAIDLNKLGDINKSLDAIEEIIFESERARTIQELGKNILKEYGYFGTYNYIKLLNKKDCIVNFTKGMANSIEVSNAEIKDIFPILNIVQNDSQSIEHLLQMHALNNLFFKKSYTNNKLQKFNSVLNLQWAIDLKKELDQLQN
jgi:hypothetical protein